MSNNINTCKYFVDGFEDRISINIKRNLPKILQIISKYIDKNSEVLFDIGPIERLYFGENDKNFIFELLDVTPKELKEVIKISPAIDDNWKISSNEFNLLMTLMIRELTKAKKKKEAEYCISYLSCALYSSINFKYFRFEPNRNIMTFTINNLSNKYLIKQLGSLYKAIHATAIKSHDTYKDELLEGTDKNVVKYINSLKTRLDNLIQNIAKEFYKNHQEGNYFNSEQDNYEEDNYYITDNTSFTISRISDKVTMEVLSRGIDQQIAKNAANMCGVSVNAVRNALNDLINKKDEEIKELITLILQLYLMDGKHKSETVGSTKFIVSCLEIYNKNNSVDESILRIKELLDIWLNECSAQYKKTERIATLSAYRKSIYVYFVFLISKKAK